MARTYAAVLTSIWGDPDFRKVSAESQRLYLFLLSQQNLNQVGLIPVTLKRWAQSAPGISPADIEKQLRELDAKRYVVFDDDTDEVLVRTYIRNSGSWRQPLIVAAMAGAATGIESVRVRRALLAELDRIPLDDLDDKVSARSGMSTRQQVETRLVAVREVVGNDLPTSDISDGETDAKGYVEGYAKPSREGMPKAPCMSFSSSPVFDLDLQDPKTSASPDQPTLPGVGLDLPGGRGRIAAVGKLRQRIEDTPEFSEFWGIYPRKEAKPAARKAWQKALNSGAEPGRIIEAARKHRHFHELECTEMKYIPHAATWLNGERFDDTPQFEATKEWNSTHRPQAPVDQKVTQTLAKRTGDTSAPSPFAASLFSQKQRN